MLSCWDSNGGWLGRVVGKVDVGGNIAVDSEDASRGSSKVWNFLLHMV